MAIIKQRIYSQPLSAAKPNNGLGMLGFASSAQPTPNLRFLLAPTNRGAAFPTSRDEPKKSPALGPGRDLVRFIVIVIVIVLISVTENLTQEQFGTLVLRVLEELVGLILLDDLPAVHENYAIGDGLGKSHLVGHADHGHALLS